MLSTTKCSKRTYDGDARCDNALKQGRSQPYGSPLNHSDGRNTKRHKSETIKIINISDSNKGPWNPFKVQKQHVATLSSEIEPFPTTFGALHQHGIDAFSSSMSNASDSSVFQDSSASFYSAERDRRNGHSHHYSAWKGPTTPTTGSYTISSSVSRAEPEENEFNQDHSIDAYPHSFALTTHTEQDVSHVTGNSDWFCNLEMRNSLSENSANPTSNDLSCRRVPEHVPSSEMVLGPWDTHWLATQDNFGGDSSHYHDIIGGNHAIPYTELASRPCHTLISESAWYQPRNSTMNDTDKTSAPAALATTACMPPFTNSSVYIDNRPFEPLNPCFSQECISSKRNDELSNQLQYNDFHYAGPASQEQVTSRSRVLLEVSVSSIPSIIQISHPVEMIDDVRGNSTGIRLQIENPLGTESENPGKAKENKKIRGRQGGLGREKAQKVHVIRKIRACFHCWAHKTPCSEGVVCAKCEDSKWSMSPRLCTRANLKDYYKIFFPPFLVSHLKARSVQHLSRQISRGFSGKHVKIGVSCGSHFLPMQLKVAEYTPVINTRFGTVPLVTSKNGAHVFTDRKPAPMALPEVNLESLPAACKRHAELMTTKLHDFVPSKKEGIGSIPNRVIRAISRYHGMKSPSSNRKLLTQAMMLYSTHYFMGRRITYSGESTMKVNEALKIPNVNAWDSNLVSHLLNSQIKSVMQAIRKETTREVLEELEKELKRKDKKTWTTCFSVIMILCMCIEEGQTAMNGIFMHKKTFEPDEAPSSETVVGVCRELDEMLYNHMTQLFHAIFKTDKYPSSTKPHRVFNPIRDGLQDEADESLRRDAEFLVFEIKQIIDSYEDELKERAETPSVDTGDETLTHHMRFRELHSARLVARFLLSFQAV